ncbi:methyltransferase [Strigomonas culicis]|uniref:Methyltransferase n=1 Tax=Strigomonas culicis TaxID=28005 RepID=S9W618_9TRYP|nr:methyltransferase [Strigomonas culicis]|eukprot:EPY31385.1 methyltransferase [Strigomonas culicis]
MWTHWLCHNYLRKARSPPQPLRVLDMCCGTGCIGVAIAKHVPTAHVTAVDLLPAAVATARENAAKNGVPPDRFDAQQSDMFELFFDPATKGDYPASAVGDGAAGAVQTPSVPVIADAHRGTFDVLVSNPPYVLPEQYVVLPLSILDWESKYGPRRRRLPRTQAVPLLQGVVRYGRVLLKPKHARHPALQEAPNIAIEVGLQAHVVASIMEKSGWFENVEVHLDYAQQERWVTASSKH